MMWEYQNCIGCIDWRNNKYKHLYEKILLFCNTGVGGDGVYKQTNGIGVTSSPDSHSHSQGKLWYITWNILMANLLNVTFSR